MKQTKLNINIGDFKIWLATLVPFVVSGIIFQTGTLRQIKDISKMRNEVRFSNVEFATSKDKANELARLKIELSETESKINDYKKGILNPDETPEFLNILSKIADESGIKFINISPKPVKDAGFCMAMPVRIEFESSYTAFIEYLFKVEQLPGLMKVDNLSSNSAAEGQIIKAALSSIFFVNKDSGLIRETKLDAISFKRYPYIETSPFIYAEKRTRDVSLSSKKGLELTAVVSGEACVCIINGQICHVEDEIDGYKVVEIRNDRVVLMDEKGDRVLLELKGE